MNIQKYFQNEIDNGMFDEIIHFLSSYEIREGKFEGNEVLIDKINRDTAVVYLEYELADGKYEYSRDAIVVNINKLIDELQEWKNNSTLHSSHSTLPKEI